MSDSSPAVTLLARVKQLEEDTWSDTGTVGHDAMKELVIELVPKMRRALEKIIERCEALPDCSDRGDAWIHRDDVFEIINREIGGDQ